MLSRMLFPLILLSAFVEPASAQLFKAQTGCKPHDGQAKSEISVLPVSDVRKARQARPPDYERTLAAAAVLPLGSKGNPVRVFNPSGQRVYLASLRCADGRSPTYCRNGSVGIGPFGTILDSYDVRCPGSTPAQSDIHLDMYHADHLEDTAPPGFGFEAPKGFRMMMKRSATGSLEPDANGDVDTFVLVAAIRR